MLTTPLRALTLLGRGVLGAGIVAAVITAQLHWQEFTQLAYVAFGLLALAVLWQLLPGAPKADLALRPHRTIEGSTSPSVSLEVQAGAAPLLFPRVVVAVGSREVPLALPYLGPFAHHREEVDLPAMPRGVHPVGPVVYQKTDPVGLITRRIRTGPILELLVAPRVTDLAVFAGGLTNDLDGATSQQLSMSDLAFHALREYVPGDDLRHVHWRSSAKAGELLVRQYHDTRRGHVTVLVDDARSSYPRPGDFELAVSVATSIALRAVRDDFDTVLRCGDHLASGRHEVAMKDAACRFAMVGVDDYVARASEAAGSDAGAGLVVQVTGADRDLVDLDRAAAPFGAGSGWIVVRADSGEDAWARDSGSLRELSVPDLAQLQQLLGRGMR